MTVSRPVRNRTIGLAVGLGLSAVLVFGAATPAFAGPLATPSSGPVAGGTTVSLGAATLGFTQIAQGGNTGYGLSGDGHIYAWGDNGSAELGDGSTAPSSTPVRVLRGAIPVGVTITQIAAGSASGYALGSNGAVYAWGANDDGQLGDGSKATRNEPVAVVLSGLPAGVTVLRIAAGAMDAYAIGSDGNIYSWGYGFDGELGDGGTALSTTPVVVAEGARPAGVGFTQVAAGDGMAFGIGTDGQVYSWGWNVTGALGTGDLMNQDVPTALSAGAIPVGVEITRVASGQEGGYALGDDGKVYAWGSDLFGDLGDGGSTDQDVPVAVVAGDIPGGVTITAIAAGSSSAYAVGSDGHIFSWGNGGNGQLGNGSGAESNTPVLVSEGEIPSGVTLTSVSGGYHSAIALGSDDRVYGWGDDNSGDLADGTTTQRETPVLGANAVVTRVTFGGVAGTDVIDPPGVTTVVTPPHAGGAVAVVVSGTMKGGVTSGVATSRTIPAAFTFVGDLPVTGAAFPWWLLVVGCAALLSGVLLVTRRRAPVQK